MDLLNGAYFKLDGCTCSGEDALLTFKQTTFLIVETQLAYIFLLPGEEKIHYHPITNSVAYRAYRKLAKHQNNCLKERPE